MKNKVISFLKSQKGINTVEVVIILAIMVGLAILFREQLGSFAEGIMKAVFSKTGTDWTSLPTSTPK